MLGTTLADCFAGDPGRRTRRVADGTVARATKACRVAPPFGATPATTVAEAALMRELLLTYDLFGAQLGGVVATTAEDERRARCQHDLLRRAQRGQATRYRAFGRCAARGVANGAVRDAPGLAACLEAGARTVARACERALTARLARASAGVDLGTAFPRCGAGDAGALGRCLGRAIACGACTALDRAHALGADCDRLDDGLGDGSCVACPPAGPLPDGAALYRDLVTYVDFGIRRTGTPGAASAATWLADTLGRNTPDAALLQPVAVGLLRALVALGG